MDLFGDSSDDDDVSKLMDTEIQGMFNTLFTMVVKQRSQNKTHGSTVIGDLKIAIVLHDSEFFTGYSSPLVQKLKAAKFNGLQCFKECSEVVGMWDFMVLFCEGEQNPSDKIWTSVVPGGHLTALVTTNQWTKILSNKDRWITDGDSVVATYNNTEYRGGMHRKQLIRCNPAGALYWATLSDQLERETANANAVTVGLSTHERAVAVMSDVSVEKAADALSQHGVCIIRGIFDANKVKETATLALKDLELAKEELLKRGIDLTKPGCGGPPINNFHELSMREALRVDLRNGKHMKNLGAAEPEAEATSPQQNPYFRTNASILRVLETVMNPSIEEVPGHFRGGNWGRWNFGGLGPDAPPPPPIAGEVGAVVSLPGCLDQTIHADTAHLFDHVQLPAHYVNLFVPGVVDDVTDEEYMSIGQTVFITGSHQLDISSRLMNTADEGESELEGRMIRPHLDIGDALLFDCRVLHFGLANNSASTNRPILYVNFHHPSFRDPKNWNDAERLFGTSSK